MRRNKNFKRLVIFLTAAIMVLSVASVVNADFFDFESNDGGWVPTADWDPVGDWEYTDSYDVINYVGSHTPPPNAYSGDGLWGTVIYDDYTNAGGTNYLSQTFDWSGVAPADARLSFYEWVDIFGSFDYGQVFVNGVQEYYVDTYNPTAWQYVDLDLSAYAGLSSVEIEFALYTTTVVEYAGWYIDDVQVGPGGGGGGGSGNDCDDPIVVEIPGDLQFDDLGQTTCGKLDDYSDTDLNYYDGGEDIIYELVVTADTNIIVDVTADTSWVGAGLFDACPDVGTMVESDTYGPNLNFNYNVLASESPYYLMIDTWPTPDCTEFDLTISFPQNDVGVISIIHPIDADGLDPIYPEVEVQNFGAFDEVDVPVHMTVTHLAGGGILLSEGFEGSFPPAGWTIQTYGATTYEWEQWAYSDTTYSYEPPGSGLYYAVAQDDQTPTGTDVDTGLFTPSMDLSGFTSVDLDFDQCFQDFANYGESEVRTYSGGSLEEVLLFQTTDGPLAGEHTTLTFDPSTYGNPSDVQIEFWYTDDNYDSGAWGFAIDDVEVYAAPGIVTDYDSTELVDLDVGETKNVDTFSVWNPSSGGLYDVEVCTELVGDGDTTNDCIEALSVIIGFVDVGVNSIDFPQALMGPAPFEPKATVENFGDTALESVPVHCWIEGGEELKFTENFENVAAFNSINKEIGFSSDIDTHMGEGSIELIGEIDTIRDFSDWSVVDLDGDGTTWHQTDYNSCEGTYSAYSGVEGVGYNSNSDDFLISPQIDVGTGGRIECEVDYDIEPAYFSVYDYLYIGNSANGINFYGDIYYGNSGGCIPISQDLYPDYIAPDGSTYICFLLHSDFSVNYDGAFVDNVEVYGGGLVYNQTINPDLAYGEEKQLTFPEFVPPKLGDYTMNVCTEFEIDENPTNDCQDFAFNNDAPVYNEITGFGYSSIQDAIDDASPGDTIIVRDGQYYEDIVIDKAITVTGENPPINTTVLYGTVTITGDGATFMNFKVQPLAVLTDDGAAITITANDVTVQHNIVTGLRGLVDPNDPLSTEFTIKGIHVDGGSGTYSGIVVSNNVVTDIVNENLTYGGGGGTSIYYEDFSTCPPTGWMINDGEALGYTWDCVTETTWSSEYWVYSVLTGANDPSGNAMWVDDDGFGSGTDSYEELYTTVDCSGFTDVYLDFSGVFNHISTGNYFEVLVEGNQVYYVNNIDTDFGTVGPIDVSTYADNNAAVDLKFIYDDGSDNWAWGALIDDVEFTGTPMTGGGGPTALYGGAIGIMIEGSLDNIQVTNNEVTDIHSAGWCYGIEVIEIPTGAAPTGVSVEDNYIAPIGSGDVYDVWDVPNLAPLPGVMFNLGTGVDATDITLKCNMFDIDCFSDAYAVYNHNSNLLDATFNWWGKPDGPNSDHINGLVYDPVSGLLADGMGSEIVNLGGPISFDPWLGIHAEANASTLNAETGQAIVFDGEGSFEGTCDPLSQTIIFEEHFDSSLGGFTTDNFAWDSGNDALGDTTGQAMLYWLNSDDDDYLLSPVFDGSSATTLEFKDYEDCFSTTYDCYFFVEVYDGSSWQDVTPWMNPITGDVGPNTWSIDISAYQNPNMQIQFRFGYDGFNLMYWYIDDVVVTAAGGGGGDRGEVNDPEQYYWDFDDGLYSFEKQIGHVYNTPGTYHVSLRVRGDGLHGVWSGKMYDWAYLTVNVATPGSPLSANADGENLGGYETTVETPITFYGSASGGSPPYTYYWDFGDGTGGTTVQNPTNVYKDEGTYTISLTVYDNEGMYATDTAEVTVYGFDVLVANIYCPSNAMTNNEVSFDGLATGGTAPYTYEWDFGDGTISNLENPVHIYENPGQYTVTLTISDDKGNSDTTSKVVIIETDSAGTSNPEIKEVKGGFGIKATIDAGTELCCWNISVDGDYVFFGESNEGEIEAESEETVKLGFSIAIGKVNVTVKAGQMEKEYTAFALGPFYLNLQEA